LSARAACSLRTRYRYSSDLAVRTRRGVERRARLEQGDDPRPERIREDVARELLKEDVRNCDARYNYTIDCVVKPRENEVGELEIV
jgi:hypothetical protein